MKKLSDYVLGVKKDHKYTFRIAQGEISDRDLTRLENNLKAHDLISIASPVKTIFQAKPMGFDEPMNSEVVIIDITLGQPASCFYLGRLIARILKISEIHVVVNGHDNPLDADNKKLLSKEQASVDSSEYYGDQYNKNMLKTILDARKDQTKQSDKTSK